jgi:hypothetical protein
MPNKKENAIKQLSIDDKRTVDIRKAEFVGHLEHASSIVRLWPAWKQQILGGTYFPAENIPPKDTKN